MANPIWDFASGLIKPITDLIGKAVPDADKKLDIQAATMQMQFAVATKMMDYESQLLEAQAKVITAEAMGASWIQRNWRPITMLTFLALVVCDSFGWLPNRLADQAWLLLQIGLGGYVAGRSIEKVAPAITAAISSAKAA